MSTVNLDGVKAWSGISVPPGRYLARVDDAKATESTGGHPQLEIVWTVAQGEHEGSEKTEWMTLSQAALGKLVSLLQAVGINATGEVDLAKLASELIGKKAVIVVREEPKGYGDNPTETVVKIAGHQPPTAAAPGAEPLASSNGAAASTARRDDVPFLWEPVSGRPDSPYNPFV